MNAADAGGTMVSVLCIAIKIPIISNAAIAMNADRVVVDDVVR